MTDVKHALVVDDEPFICDLVGSILELRGYETDSAGDGVAATEKLRERTYDLVLSDIKMPRMDGLELLLHLRALDKRVPVLVMTGHGGDEERVKAEQLGALFLRKPFQVDLLNSILDRIEAQSAPVDGPVVTSEATERLVGSQNDRRHHARAKVSLTGRLHHLGAATGDSQPCRIIDVGLGGGGLRLEVTASPPTGTAVRLDLDEAGSTLRDLAGQVIWSQGDRCGVAFRELSTESALQLENLIVEALRAQLEDGDNPYEGQVIG